MTSPQLSNVFQNPPQNVDKIYNGQKVANFTLNNTNNYLRCGYPPNVRPVTLKPILHDSYFDCTGWVYYVIKNTYPSLAKAMGVGSSDLVENYANKHGGIRKNNPKVGNFAIWKGHVEFVTKVNGDSFETSGSAGYDESPIPTTKKFKGLNDKILQLYGNYKLRLKGLKTFVGFWDTNSSLILIIIGKFILIITFKIIKYYNEEFFIFNNINDYFLFMCKQRKSREL